jgi:hypothetical protein
MKTKQTLRQLRGRQRVLARRRLSRFTNGGRVQDLAGVVEARGAVDMRLAEGVKEPVEALFLEANVEGRKELHTESVF